MADMEAMDKLRLERVQNFKNVISGKGKIDHIPHYGNYWSWKYYDAGYKLSEALYDYDKMYNAMDQFFTRYPMDVCAETGWRNPIQVTSTLTDENRYIINDDTYSLSVKDQCYMDDGDYEALIANPKKYLWETFLPKKYNVLRKEKNNKDFQRLIQKYGEFGAFMGRTAGLGHAHGLADWADPDGAVDYCGSGYEVLFCHMRGMKNLSVDIRRRPEQVKDACQALDEAFSFPRYERGMAGANGSHPEFCVDMNPVMLGHVILNPKQFEKYYWPLLQRVAKVAEEKDKLVFIYIEGSAKRFWDFFRELPKDRFALVCELDDVYEMKKALPNCVIAGGMSAELLGRGTAQACVEETKKLVETLGGDNHRYIFSTGKMISFPNDCKRENLAAVCEYLNSLKY